MLESYYESICVIDVSQKKLISSNASFGAPITLASLVTGDSSEHAFHVVYGHSSPQRTS